MRRLSRQERRLEHDARKGIATTRRQSRISGSERGLFMTDTPITAYSINLNLRRLQVSVKLAEMIIENLADDPSKQMFE